MNTIGALVNMMIILYLAITIALSVRAPNKRRAVGVLIIMVLGLWFLAYYAEYYMHVTTPITELILNTLGNVPMKILTGLGSSLSNAQFTYGNNITVLLVNKPFNDPLLNALYYLGLFTYIAIVSIALVSIRILRAIIDWLNDLVRGRRE